MSINLSLQLSYMTSNSDCDVNQVTFEKKSDSKTASKIDSKTSSPLCKGSSYHELYV